MSPDEASPIDECCVLIPSATLEDFPTDGTDEEARGLLAAWTVLWHPELLARTRQTPTWYRADAPPEPDGARVIAVPSASLDQIPKNYRRKCEANPRCRWLDGADRSEMLGQLDLQSSTELQFEHRTISIADFFAIGYSLLQVQVMTRRLRYTSNLDELYLQTRVIDAAEAFLAGDAAKTAEALHDAYDALAEERDHYFSSDPHLIDLQLLTPDILRRALDDDWLKTLSPQTPTDGDDHGVLPRPSNVLIDAPVADEIAQATDGRYDPLKQMLADSLVGWAGGAPDAQVCFDALSFDDAEKALNEGLENATASIGTRPSVFARFTGALPSDMTATLVALGYVGMIPIDFAMGTGFGEESKVIQQGGGAEIESLTAKPIDAASDSAFLNLGARLGESIDGGEIATALLAHWPGKACDSFLDLRRAASWSVALGKFWTLDDYFRVGEKPYHHATHQSDHGHSDEFLGTLLRSKAPNGTIESFAKTFRESVIQESRERTVALASLVSGKSATEVSPRSASDDDVESASGILATALGAQVVSADSLCSAMMLINPHGVGCRVQSTIAGGAPAKSKHVYAATRHDSKSTDVTVDVTACGFSTVKAGERPASQPGLARRLFGGGEKNIADQHVMTNEFMVLSIDPKSGGVASVYSGGERGNRFSMRLVHASQISGNKSESEMVCDRFEVVTNSPVSASLRCTGKLIGKDKSVLGEYTIQYQLQRGSRLLHVTGNVTPKSTQPTDPWKNYIASRVAVVNDSAIVRTLVRDKIHRSSRRRMISPLGVLIDEAERQTLVASFGNAFHRRVGDRFLDTLITTGPDKDNHSFQFAIGFDTTDPLSTAKSLIAPPSLVPIDRVCKVPEQGWLAHVSPADCNLTRLHVAKRDDGKLAALVRIVNGRPSSARMAIRFCRSVEAAAQVRSGTDHERIHWTPEDAQASDLECKDDAILLTAGGHEVVDLAVVFASKSDA
ncbi:hypothetical protein [Stieleria varia]|uniref:Glycosyl hydrolase family 38 C-terminal domain-containing protein n=1 Tax=Stieleria varia TaxID=2528005 RepID=A0A5C6ANU7_9BACT|nr:hypothetical protein [Stieleria varia]TWU01111.1 hypothetical protein Pla52n_44830 [Stieleria varia]